MLKALDRQNRRKQRARTKLKTSGRPRLSVFRSGKHIYAQVIVDAEGVTKAAASTKADFKTETANKGATKDMAAQVGKLVAERAAKAGITEVVFDKGSYRYHGQVASLADGAREAGLKF